MRMVEKYYNFYIPILNRARSFRRQNAQLSVPLTDNEVVEIGSDNLKTVFPEEYTAVDVRAVPFKTESRWLVTATIKEWECD